MKFVVYGDPVPKGRPKFCRRGNFVKVYTPEKTEKYEKLVADTARLAMGPSQPHAGPVSVVLGVYMPIPKSWSKKKRAMAIDGLIYPTSKTDIDNVSKSVLDGMNAIVYLDDGQAVDLTVSKRFSDDPRVEVSVDAVN